MKMFGLRGWSGWEEDMGDGRYVGRLGNLWMKDAKRSSLAHTLKGDAKEEIVEDM